MRALIAAHPFKVKYAAALHVTASFGVAGFESVDGQGDLSVDVLIGQADACLYRSNELGRNRVTSLALPD